MKLLSDVKFIAEIHKDNIISRSLFIGMGFKESCRDEHISEYIKYVYDKKMVIKN